MKPAHYILREALKTDFMNIGQRRGVNVPVGEPPAHLAEDFHVASSLALKLAKSENSRPDDLAREIVRVLSAQKELPFLRIEQNMGFVNAAMDPESIDILLDPAVMEAASPYPDSIPTLLDFGGPNLKPMHVGHLRSLVIGEALRRILSHVGHPVVSDVHWGDWGLPQGLIMAEALRRQGLSVEQADRLKITPEEVANLYPASAKRAKDDPGHSLAARELVRAIQSGASLPLINAWASLASKVKSHLAQTFHRLGVHFDLSLGESDAVSAIPEMMRIAHDKGVAREDLGAIIVDVGMEGDSKEMPPVILRRADGTYLYAATDLATLVQRFHGVSVGHDLFVPKRVIYVADERQSLHFTQVFRAAHRMEIVTPGSQLVHTPFGTVNGGDGKPLRTRDGNTPPLNHLIDQVVEAARVRLQESDIPQDERNIIAEQVGLSALRIHDLARPIRSNYEFDVDKVTRFEGDTGAALLYAVVRLRSLIARANEGGGSLIYPCTVGDDHASRSAMRLALSVSGTRHAIFMAAETLEPCHIVEHAYGMASDIGRFLSDAPVLKEQDMSVRRARIALLTRAEQDMSLMLDLLGCQIPERM